MLPAYIIDQLKREQEDIDRRFEETRLPLYLPLPEPPRAPPKDTGEVAFEIQF